MRRTKLSDRSMPDYTHGEEVANMVTHIVGGAFGIAATVLCVIMAALHHNVMGVVTGAIYGATLIELYTMSSVYHGLSPRLFGKRVLRVLDHCSVYFLIAGTYTPIALCSVRSINTALGWVLFGVVWGVAALGMTFTAIDLESNKKFEMICYIGLGWCVVLTLRQVIAAITWQGFILLLAGGLAYTLGAVLYGLGKKHRYFHSVFHLFVLAGSVLQFFCILLYVM